MSTAASDHVTSGDMEISPSANDEKYATTTTKYDCYPSWQGEFCDNIPHYTFCQFWEKKKKMTTPTIQQHQQGAVSQITYSLSTSHILRKYRVTQKNHVHF